MGMPQPIAYNTGSQTSGSLKLNGIEYAISSSIVSGSNGQKWFTSVNPGNGIVLVTNSYTQSYSTYQNSTPLFYTASALTAAAITGAINGLPDRFGQVPFTTTASAFAWVANSRKYFMMNYEYPQIVTDGLIYLSDAKFLASYPTTQSIWYNLNGNGTISGSLINSVAFNSQIGVFNFDNTDDQIIILGPDYNALALSGNFTIIITGKKTQYGTGGNNVGNSTLFQGVNNGYDNGWRILETHNGTPGTSYSLPHTIQIGLPDIFSGRAVSDTVYRPFFYAFSFTNGNTGLAFLNGYTSQGANSYKGSSSPNYGNIGFNGGFGVGRWGGYIGKTLIYNRGLSLNEINQNYYGGPIVTNGLVFAVDAGNIVSYESGSTTTYSLTGSFTGSLENGVGYLPSNGGVFNFDGVDDIIRSQNVNPSEITLEIWKKWTLISDDWLLTNTVSTVTDTTYGYYMRIDSPSTTFTVYFGIGSGANRAIAYTPTLLNEWTHVVATYDPITEGAKLYWNGVLVGTNTGTGAIDYTGVQGLTIGAANDLSRGTPGPVGPVRIYNRALTAQEIAQNFNAQRSRFGL
jgi:hypothetical protein